MIKKRKCSPWGLGFFCFIEGKLKVWRSPGCQWSRDYSNGSIYKLTNGIWSRHLQRCCLALGCIICVLCPSYCVKIGQKYIYWNVKLQCSGSVRVEIAFLSPQQEFCSSLWDCFAVYCVFLESPLEEVRSENFQPQNPRNILNLQKEPFFSHRSCKWPPVFSSPAEELNPSVEIKIKFWKNIFKMSS